MGLTFDLGNKALLFAGNRGAFAGGGFPVDLLEGVAVAKVAQLMKLQAQPATLLLAHAQLTEPVTDRQELRAADAGKIGIDPGLSGQRQYSPPAPQPQRARQQQFAAGKTKVPTCQWSHPVAELGLCLGL